MRACMTTIGAIEGNIIAAIITTQAVIQKPKPPRSVPGPASMPDMRSPVTAQAMAASSTRPKINPSWIAAGNGGARRSVADSIWPYVPSLAATDGVALGLVALEVVVGRLAVEALELDA